MPKKNIKTNQVVFVGYSLLAPGANSAQEFWNLLIENRQAIVTYKLSDRVKTATGEVDTSEYAGGLLKHPIDEFDADYFNIGHEEALLLDPQQRLLLETATHALEHAGITGQKLSHLKTGIYIGTSNQDFSKVIAKHGDVKKYSRFVNAGNSNSTIAGRLGYYLKAKGPCVVFDTACASSLTALHYAKASLENNEVDIAIVGGANIILSPEFSAGDEVMGVISKSATVSSFSDKADGYVRSEGIAVLVMTRFDLAKKQQLTIRGVLKASQMNQEVDAKYFTMPGANSQAALIQNSLNAAKLLPTEIDVIEGHATATAKGDAIELTAIEEVFASRATAKPLWLCSSKPNIGHTEAPSGLISLIKILLALEFEKLPGQINYTQHNSLVAAKNTMVLQKPTSWKKQLNHVRRAGITSLSFSGANLHLIVEEAPLLAQTSEEKIKQQIIRLNKRFQFYKQLSLPRSSTNPGLPWLIITAKNKPALMNQLLQFKQFLLSYPDDTKPEMWLDICYSSGVHKEQHASRLIISAPSIKAAIQQIELIAADAIDIKNNDHIKFSKDYLLPDLSEIDLVQAIERYRDDGLFQAIMNSYQSFFPIDIIDMGMFLTPTFDIASISSAAQMKLRLLFQFALTQRYASAGLSPKQFYTQGSGCIVAAMATGCLSLPDAINLLEAIQSDSSPVLSFTLEKTKFRNGNGKWAQPNVVKKIEFWLQQLSVEAGAINSADKITINSFSYETFLENVKEAFLAGYQIDWETLWFGADNQFVKLPFYMFDTKKFWPAFLGGVKAELPVTSLARTDKTDDVIILHIYSKLLKREISNIDSSFFDMGGNSLKLAYLKDMLLARLGVDFSLKVLFELDTARKIADALPSARIQHQDLLIIPDLNNQYKPFPLTSIQEAYWVGREKPASLLGALSTHLYYEIAWNNLNIDQLEKQLNVLIARHPMLRARVLKSGEQEVLENVPYYQIKQHDLTHCNSDEANEKILELRNALSHEKFACYDWPLFKVEAVQLADKTILILSFDCLIVDMFSLHMLMREWYQLYQNAKSVLPEINISFRDYVIATKDQQSARYLAAKDYWLPRIKNMPAAPDLPILKSIINNKPTFDRVTGRIPKAQWEMIKSKALVLRVSPTSVLFALYAKVISAWSQNKDFLLNLTLFKRKVIHADVNHLVGDFTLVELFSVNKQDLYPESINKFVKTMHSQLWDDLEYSDFDGVAVLRELAKKPNNVQDRPLAPVIFTSLLNVDAEPGQNSLFAGEHLYGITQTPQCWLDHKIFEVDGDLISEWDFVKDLFDSQMINDMHHSYCKLVNLLAAMDWQNTLPSVIPDRQHELLNFTPTKKFAQGDKALHQLFDAARKQYPQRVAIASGEVQLTYQQVYATAQALARQLIPLAKENELIAVLCPPGWQQIVSCLAIHYAGAAYLPLDVHWPKNLINEILETTQAKAMISCQSANSLALESVAGLPTKIHLLDQPTEHTIEHIDHTHDIDSIAYVIFTSGTTGKSKGVVISHRSAVNTVLDINDRYGVIEHDAVFAISKLSFDLSVYDIFGALACGAKIVTPNLEDEKDPALWFAECVKQQVTIWNSVPKIMEMLVTYLLSDARLASLAFPSLRLVMMSGDWIPTYLPKKIQQSFPNQNIRLISLGGATEGSIWSIAYEITAVDANWNSIPYGKALTNQTMMILDENMERVPVGVLGDIYIGGAGVAQCYWKDEEKTRKAFKINPQTQQYVYFTGDKGYINNYGEMIFCGRTDNQVKFNGFRIELDGISQRINQLPLVANSVVFPIEANGEIQLVAFVKKEKSNSAKQLEQSIKGTLLTEDEKIQHKLTVPQEFYNKHLVNTKRLPLPRTALDKQIKSRKSYRQFTDDTLTEQAIYQLFETPAAIEYGTDSFSLAALLSTFSAIKEEQQILPKYLYSSAGSTYPIKIYLSVGINNQGIATGIYYYHPVEHALYRLSASETELPDPGISLLLIANMNSIKPIYGERSYQFIHYEYGSMTCLLDLAASKLGWEANPQGELSKWANILNLSAEDIVLNCFPLGPAKTSTISKTHLPASLNYYLYVQSEHSDLAVGLYQYIDNKLRKCQIQNDYPICLDHTGDNANLIHAAPAIIIVTADSADAQQYRNLGAVGQQLMMSGSQQLLGLCPLGLPIFPSGMIKHIAGSPLMAFALGPVSVEQQLDLAISQTNKQAPTIANYLHNQLRQQALLTSYMMPSDFVVLDEIPLTANSKVDKKGLIQIYLAQHKTIMPAASRNVVTDNESVTAIADIISKVLKREIDLTKSVVENGINSFNAYRIKLALEEHNYTILASDIINRYTLHELIQIILTKSNHSLPPTLSLPAKTHYLAEPEQEPIAIIGMSCRFPGANDLDAFWTMLAKGLDGLTYLPGAGKNQLKSFGVIDGMLDFDNSFFQLSKKQSLLMHPAQRVWLESVYHALEDAGYSGDRKNERIGLYASAGGEPYLHASYYTNDGLLTRTSNEIDYFATRAAYQFNFTGPVLTVQSACSSSLAAIHLAIRSLRNNEASIMIAGGIHTSRFAPALTPATYPEASIFSQQGQCQPFSSSADGIVETQGVGTVVLKKLSKAKADGDHIYASLLGSAVLNDGNLKRDFTSPNGQSQRAVIQAALLDAKVESHTISAVEAHGTGTPIGDPIEIEALRTVFDNPAQAKQSIAIGSVKGNIGHTVTAAGVAGVIKTGLALHNKILPGSLHAKQLNPLLDLERSSFYVNKQAKTWPTVDGKRRAGVSSFGMGGTNAHVILEEAPIDIPSIAERLAYQWQSDTNSQPPAVASMDDGAQLILLSAKTKSALANQVARYLKFLQTQTITYLPDLAYTLSVGREHMPHRLVITAATIDTVIAQLRAVNLAELPNHSAPLRYHADVLQHHELDQFASWYQRDACYRALVDSCAVSFSSVGELGHLSTAIRQKSPSEPIQKALSMVYLFSAIRRYQSCSLTPQLLDNTYLSELLASGAALTSLLQQVLLQPLSVATAVADATVISLAGAQQSFQRTLSLAYQQGQAIDWHGYWRGSIRQKIHAPLYPFEREHYWLDNAISPAAPTTAAVSAATGLLGAGPITNEGDGYTYQQELDIDSVAQNYLKDHHVLASCVFPGAGYSELLVSAARRLDMTQAVDILTLSYQEPLQLSQGEIRVCQVKLSIIDTQKTGAAYQAVIKSWVKGAAYATAITHAQGEVRLAPLSAQLPPQIDVSRMRRQYVKPQAIDNMYAALAADGVYYDHYFRGVQEFSLNTKQTKGFAKLQLDKALSPTGHSIHPVLLDSAFQTLAGLLLLYKAVPPDMTYIPVGHGLLRYYSDIGSAAYAQVTSQSATLTTEMNGDIALYNEHGKLAMLVCGLQLKQIPKALLQQRLNPATLCYRRQWEALALPTTVVSKKRTWLVMGGDAKLSEAVCNQLAQQDEQVLALPATTAALIEKTQTLTGPVGIIYLDSLLSMPTGPINNPGQVLVQQQTTAAWNLVTIAQTLGKSALTLTRFLILTQQAVKSQLQDTIHNLSEGLYLGLSTSLAAAKTAWQVSLLDIDNVKHDNAAQIMAKEALQTTDTELMVSYRQSNRYVARLQPDNSFMQMPTATLLFKPNESCLVTGGLGGIGLRLTEWLVSKGARNIVVMTRRPRLSEPVQFESWRKAGINIDLAIVDVSLRESLVPTFTRLREEKRPLAGIFHLAGVLRDKLLDNLTAEDVNAVFAAKVLSGYYLHELSLVEPQIRYFVLFSSLVSIIGSLGQINYAAANSALDSLSEYRAAQGLPSQRINFGAWAEVGMAADLSEAQRQRGLDQISVKEGLQAVENSLKTANCNVIVTRVNWEKIWRGRSQSGLLTRIMNLPKTSKGSKITALIASSKTREELTKIIEDYVLQKIIAARGQADIDLKMGIQELLRDSLLIQSLEIEIKADFEDLINLENEMLWNYPTIAALVNYLVAKLPEIKPVADDQPTAAKNDLDLLDKWQKSLPSELKLCYFGSLELLKKMISPTRHVDTYKDNQGRTALYVATCAKQQPIITWLIARGADPKAQTKFEVSAFDIARLHNEPELTTLFENTKNSSSLRLGNP